MTLFGFSESSLRNDEMVSFKGDEVIQMSRPIIHHGLVHLSHRHEGADASS